jgi:hypothetical protein
LDICKGYCRIKEAVRAYWMDRLLGKREYVHEGIGDINTIA